jgi:membrane protease YdiL (CAAX protease family)
MNISTHRSQSHRTAVPAGKFDWPLVLFFAIAYAIAWGVFGIISLIARQSGVESAQTLMALGDSFQLEGVPLSVPGWLVYLLTRLADFAFSIAGLVMIAVTAGRAGLGELWQRLTRWRIPWIWYGAGLLPILLYGVATAVAIPVAGAGGTVDLSGKAIYTILFSAQAGLFVSLFLRGAMGEELGLRGFALPRLQARMSSFRASLLIGILWAAWHLPVLLGRDVISILLFLLLAVVISFIFTWLFNGSGGSLWPVLIFHATQNAEEVFETIFPSLLGTDWELISSLGLLVIGIVVGMLLWRGHRDCINDDSAD